MVDRPNTAYGDNPYTLQSGDCGQPGDHIHLTPWYVTHYDTEAETMYGRAEKVLVHEWAKLRWGVFEEYGYPGDQKFPMFYLKTIWTADGSREIVKPNFCTNKELSGVSIDLVTGRDCTTDPLSGLPDDNCYFVPDSDNTVNRSSILQIITSRYSRLVFSSYMALPFLDSITDFCDSTEDLLHEADIPTKQNLFCNGRSPWEVIMENEDFANGNNEPSVITDTSPDIRVVKAENPKYVVVMDTSGSMTGDRAASMQDAVKRWIKFEVTEGTKVGLVTFSDSEPATNPILYELEAVDQASRQRMLEAVDGIQFGGSTCIGCGLDWALNLKGGLKGYYGNVIILVTDGQQTDGLTISDMIPQVLSRRVRVVTVALGLDADPDLEKLSVASGGMSFYVDDSGGPGPWDDAFTGSLTYQPGDVIGNKTITVHQADYSGLRAGEFVKNVYDIDASIGRETEIMVQVKVEDNNCSQPLNIWLISPDHEEENSLNKSFICSKTNFGVFHYTSKLLDLEGRWQYRLTASEDLDVSVKVVSKSRTSSDDPIITKCWIAAGAQEVDTTLSVKVAVVGEVRQGTKPVVGARVVAEVERPPDSQGNPYPAMELVLQDDGSGADKIRNDGVYSKYFSQFTGKGRYSVKCKVEGDENTGVNGGFLGKSAAYPASPGSPLCCGSDALPPGANVSRTGNFTRQTAGGAFRVTNQVDLDEDSVPPGQVVDLRLAEITDQTVRLEFTSPGDDIDNSEPVALYSVKYSATAGNLTEDNFDNNPFNEMITEADLTDSSLAPVPGGETKTILVKTSIFEPNKKYVLAMRSRDESDNWSLVSNRVTIFLPATTTSTTSTTTTTSGSGAACRDNLAFSAGPNYPDSVITCYDNTGTRLEVSADTEISPGTSCIFMSGGHLEQGLVMEFYCQDAVWLVNIIN